MKAWPALLQVAAPCLPQCTQSTFAHPPLLPSQWMRSKLLQGEPAGWVLAGCTILHPILKLGHLAQGPCALSDHSPIRCHWSPPTLPQPKTLATQPSLQHWATHPAGSPPWSRRMRTPSRSSGQAALPAQAARPAPSAQCSSWQTAQRAAHLLAPVSRPLPPSSGRLHA